VNSPTCGSFWRKGERYTSSEYLWPNLGSFMLLTPIIVVWLLYLYFLRDSSFWCCFPVFVTSRAQPTSPKQVKPNSNPGSPTRPVIARPVKANAKPPSSSLTVSPVSAGSKPTVVKSSPVAKRGRSKPPDLKFAPIDSTASALTGRGAAALNGRRSPLVSVGNRNRNALSKSPSPARKLPLDHSGASNASMDLPAEHKREREKAERAATAAAKREDLHALKQAREDDKLQAAVAAKAQVEAYEAQSKQQAQTQADWKRSERETKQVKTHPRR